MGKAKMNNNNNFQRFIRIRLSYQIAGITRQSFSRQLERGARLTAQFADRKPQIPEDKADHENKSDCAVKQKSIGLFP
ncbi:MAG: hypothetical protein ACREE6_09040 [Limisphaerales bacterium]